MDGQTSGLENGRTDERTKQAHRKTTRFVPLQVDGLRQTYRQKNSLFSTVSEDGLVWDMRPTRILKNCSVGYEV